MRTSCSHCATQFQVPDKTLGKQAKCKSCGKMFVIVPAPEVASTSGTKKPKQRADAPPRRRAADTAPQRRATDHAAPPPPPPEPDDPLDALADAAFESGHSHRPVRQSSPAASRGYDDPYEDDRRPRRMAQGASTSMMTGIIGLILVIAGVGFGIAAIMMADDQNLLQILGVIAIGLILIAGAMGMTAVFQGTTATRNIRRARHPIGGRSQASTGILLGWITLGLVLLAAIGGVIWLSQRGGITFQEIRGPDPANQPGTGSPAPAQPAAE